MAARPDNALRICAAGRRVARFFNPFLHNQGNRTTRPKVLRRNTSISLDKSVDAIRIATPIDANMSAASVAVNAARINNLSDKVLPVL